MTTLESPTNRRAEVLNIMINSEWFNYYDLAKQLNNLNVHRTRDFLEEEHGIKFQSRFKPFKNRFGRLSRMKEFKLVTTVQKSISVYNKINKK